MTSPFHTAATLVCRPLTRADAEQFKAFRLGFLTGADRGCFAADPTAEKERPLNQWGDMLDESRNKAVFGAFVHGKLVGTMSLERWSKDQSGTTAYYRSAYISRDYRRSNVAGEIYKCRENWARKHGYTRVAFAIRHDNAHWLNVQLDHGAKIIETVPMIYADGISADTHILARPINTMSGFLMDNKAA